MLVVRDEETLEEKRHIPYTPARLIFFSFVAFCLIFTLGFFLASRFYKPKTFAQTDQEAMLKLIHLKLTIDSLSEELSTRNQYVDNISKLLVGDVTYMKDDQPLEEPTDKKNKIKKTRKDSINIDYLEQADIRLREELEGSRAVLTSFSGAGKNIEDLFLFSPLSGIVSEQYNAGNAHYGVDIVSEKDEPIKSVSDGTVVMASWTDDTGYVIAVQHQADLISVYKHCSSLLKKSGDFVKAGEIIAIIGNTGKFTTGPHLHFELWHMGNPLNPEELISF
ncbi:MAG: M23 family metallopeptidase [Bacteroidia bacterium]|nr:M23 family metallopeptidase [Bacteroidia bacterium]